MTCYKPKKVNSSILQNLKFFILIKRKIQNSFFLFILGGFMSLLFFQCSGRNVVNEKITVFGAASMSGYLHELKDSLARQNIKLVLNIASSGTLARQMAQGAKADFYISANEKWARYVDSLDMAQTIELLCNNRVVGILPKSESGKHHEWNILSYEKIAIGNPAHVPAGEYAMDIFNKLQVEDSLKDKLILTKDVKSAMRLVEMKECDAGMVYFSDATASKKVDIAYFPSPDLYESPTIFLVGLLNGNENSSIFKSRLSIELLKKHGFEPEIK